MKKFLLTVLFVIGFSALAHAQTATSASKFAWDQPNVSGAVEAQSYTYKLYADGSSTGTALSGVTCASAGTPAVVTCQTAITAFTPGNHTTTVSASNLAGESLKSTPLSFTFVIVPSQPANLRLQ